ncbi:MAG TPA: thioester reductase domain-containing protein, partial [Umezawaea sp.]|nr:thioester reductase domain-containing protein [Umezawaea sp.]
MTPQQLGKRYVIVDERLSPLTGTSRFDPEGESTPTARHDVDGRRPSTGRPVRTPLDQATSATVHGDATEHVRAADLTLDKFIDAATLASANGLAEPTEPVRTVLITGASGYLGRFLCLEWLRRLAPRGGTVLCLVRGDDVEQARARLSAAFDGAPELAEEFGALAERALQVLPGDVGSSRLGLDERAWLRLADEVDLIVHAAARVSHVLPYESLFAPNVFGTAEVIRLALTARRKPVAFLSSVAVVHSHFTPAPEDADIRAVNSTRTVGGRYGNGYSATKWAGEVLLREAHERFGLSAIVFRSGMVLAHREQAGQINSADVFTRLFLSIVLTGVAPRSFYPNPGRAPQYDGLPVDFTAAAVASLSERNRRGFATFNVVNPHRSDPSLDTFVDGLVDGGRPLRRLDHYRDWLTHVTASLRARPQHVQRQSLLPVLDAFDDPTLVATPDPLPADRFHAEVRASELGDVPHVDVSFLRKHIDDLVPAAGEPGRAAEKDLPRPTVRRPSGDTDVLGVVRGALRYFQDCQRPDGSIVEHGEEHHYLRFWDTVNVLRAVIAWREVVEPPMGLVEGGLACLRAAEKAHGLVRWGDTEIGDDRYCA